jgi:hypothetical protein
MVSAPDKLAARRSLLNRAASLATLLVAPTLTTITQALAEGKLAKSKVNYQETPKAGKDCDDCLHFIPGKTAAISGTCKLVEGDISPRGYCLAFTPNRKRA